MPAQATASHRSFSFRIIELLRCRFLATGKLFARADTENLGSVLMLRCKQFSQRPDVVGEASFHSWRHPQSRVYSREVVIREVQRTCSLQVVQLLREGVGQARESANRLPNGHVLPLDKTRGYVARVWPSITYLDYRFYHRRRRIATSGVVLPVIAIYLYHLGEVCLSSEYILDPLAVKGKPVCSDLETVFRRDAFPQ